MLRASSRKVHTTSALFVQTVKSPMSTSAIGSGAQSNTQRRVVQILLFLPPIALLIGVVVFHYHLLQISSASSSLTRHHRGDFTKQEIERHIIRGIHVPNRLRAQQQQQQQQHNEDSTRIEISSLSSSINDLRDEFYNRYGGKEEAMAMLKRGVQSYGSTEYTATRMLQSAAQGKDFVMSFGGYSITVGRGNFFNQSYPFVMQRILQPAFQEILNVDLVVRNSAIGGIPSFPYGFCMDHFLGADSDVISWDYSMNEGKSPAVLEAYLRQGLALPHQPMMIMLDTNRNRQELLQRYSSLGLLHDGVSLGKGEVVSPSLKELPEDQKPSGLQKWDEFGSPKRCPGRGSWHPKRMEHELIGWMLAMHFVDCLEEASKTIQSKATWRDEYAAPIGLEQLTFPVNPVSRDIPQNDDSVTELLYGHTVPDRDDKRRIEKISCRTNFLPAVDHDKILPKIVVDGLVQQDFDIMKDRPDAFYQQGWVLDVSDVERKTKQKVESCGGLGYIDMKISIYGVPASGKLRLWLPYEGTTPKTEDGNTIASTWFDDLIICEANEKRGDDACKLDSNVRYTVGGVEVIQPKLVSGAGEYLKRKTCVNIGVPAMAKVVRKKDLEGGDKLDYPDDSFGLEVGIEAIAGVTRNNGACCISHVIWEQH